MGGRGSNSLSDTNIRNSGEKTSQTTGLASLSKEAGTWVQSLTPAELAAVGGYSIEGPNGYDGINDYLRGLSQNSAYLPSRQTIDALDSAIGKFTVSNPITVERVITANGFAALRPDGTLPIGTVLTDKGYTSTTLTRDRGFIKSQRFVLQISVPVGAKGAYIETASFNKSEKEFLIHRGASYQVTSVRQGETSQGTPQFIIKANLLK